MRASISRGPLCWVLAALAGFAFANPEIDKRVLGYMAATDTPGLAVAVVRDRQIVFIRGYGKANMEHGVSVDERTVFEIGSVTKQFLATCVLMLVEEGKVNLDDKLGRYIDRPTEGEAPQWKEVTLRQCLTHTAGLADYLGVGFNVRRDYSLEELTKHMTGLKPDFAPGAGWSYSNTGFAFGGLVLEKVSGKSWSAFVKERVFDPLGMSSAQMLTAAKLVPHRAQGYSRFGAKDWRIPEPMRGNAAFACGDIQMDIRDFARWAIALDRGALLKPESYKAMWTPAELATGRRWDYGLGWMLSKANESPEIQHGGNTYGQSATIARWPAEGISVVALCNLAGQNLEPLARSIAELYAPNLAEPKPKASPDPDRALTFRLTDAIESILNSAPKAEFVSSELMVQLKTARGRQYCIGLRRGLGKLKALRYCSSRSTGGLDDRLYLGYFEKVVLPLRLKVTDEGKLFQLEPLRGGEPVVEKAKDEEKPAA